MTVWHPILAAVEVEPGHWRMVAQYERVYGEIRSDGKEYRAVDVNGRELGPFRSLRDATFAVHRADLRSHGAPEFRGYPNMG